MGVGLQGVKVRVSGYKTAVAPKEKSSLSLPLPTGGSRERGVFLLKRRLIQKSYTSTQARSVPALLPPHGRPTSKLGEANQMVSGESRLASEPRDVAATVAAAGRAADVRRRLPGGAAVRGSVSCSGPWRVVQV